MAQMQGSMGSPGYSKCAHAGCMCDVAPGKKYCSEYCEQNAGSVGNKSASAGGCGCGHAACKRG
jgi:hypothetical protein